MKLQINEMVDESEDGIKNRLVLDPIMGNAPLRSSVFLGLATIRLSDIQSVLRCLPPFHFLHRLKC